MGMRCKFNLRPSLLPEEKVLFFKKRVWAFFVESWPTYRMSTALPPLLEMALYVTDRRVLLVIYCFRVVTQEFSHWFNGKGTAEDKESIKDVSVGKSWLCGPYLEVISEGKETWYRGKEFRFRLYMKNPEPVRQIIAEEMMRNKL